MSIFQVPREGITLEFLLRPIHHVVLQPVVSALLLFAGKQYPGTFEKVVSSVTKGFTRPQTCDLLLKALLGLGVFYRLNKYLSWRVLNNSVTDRTWDWKREIVVVSGGSSGIGEQIVQQFGERNIRVVALDVSPPQSALPASATFYKMDVTSTQDIHEVAVRIRKDIGEPTVLVNNAGMWTMKLLLDETEKEVQQTFEINILAHFKMVKEFLPHMIEANHGHVVSINSIACFATWASNASYSATKAAALAFHEGLAQELRARYKADRVRTTVVHPSATRTPLSRQFVKTSDSLFVLDPATVAEAVVNQVLKDESAQLVLPARYGFMSTMRAWPSWLQESARTSTAQQVQTPK